jgi:hypothetical protein
MRAKWKARRYGADGWAVTRGPAVLAVMMGQEAQKRAGARLMAAVPDLLDVAVEAMTPNRSKAELRRLAAAALRKAGI